VSPPFGVGPKYIGDRAQLLAKLLSTMTPGRNTYAHFEYLGRLPSPPIPDYVNPYLGEGYLFSNKVPDHLKQWFQQESGDFCYTYSTKATLDKSVRKMDLPACYDFRDDPLYPRVFQFLRDKWADPMRVGRMSPSEILDDMDLTKAPGYFSTWRGFRTKLDCVVGGLIHEWEDRQMLGEIPIWKVTGKNELKETDLYVGELKQRTFIIEPIEMLWHDKRLFGKQNASIKGYWWSAYGLNPYEGGVMRIADRLRHFRRYWEFDVRGWDRLFPHMEEVQQIRAENIEPDEWVGYVCANKIVSKLVLPNGDVIVKDKGNNSGSGTTTGDNIIGMSFPLTHAFMTMGLDDISISKQLDCLIFGDDVLGGDNINVSDEVFKEVMIKTFRLYGFEFDPFIVQHELEGLSFLGFQIHEIEPGVFVPRYKLPRLAYSFIHSLATKIEVDKELSKMISLMLMSAGHGEYVYNMFRDAIRYVLINTHHPFITKMLRGPINDFLPTYRDTIHWYIGGMECADNDSFWRTVGIKEILCHVKSHASTSES